MNLFLCSRFCNVGTLIKENLQNKRIAFIPTAAAKEGASRYVLAGRELLSEMGAIVTEIDISKEDRNTIKAAFAQADCIYFSGGNSFFLMDALRKSGTDKLLKKELQRGKLMSCVICRIKTYRISTTATSFTLVPVGPVKSNPFAVFSAV